MRTVKRIFNMNDEKEIWKEIPGFDGKYLASNLGKIASIHKGDKSNPKILKQSKNNGYMVTHVVKDGKMRLIYTHRLVALAFIENPNNYPIINHKDENRTNNVVENLEWCTISYNNCYGTRVAKIKEKRKRNYSTTIFQLNKNGTFIKQYPSMIEAAR